MTPNEFWAIIDRARQRAAPNSEPAMRDALYAELVQLPALKLSAWQDLQYAYMDLAHTPKLFAAAVLINGSSSDDRFLDFTAWLVMQGKTVYASALADPDSIREAENDGPDEVGHATHVSNIAAGSPVAGAEGLHGYAHSGPANWGIKGAGEAFLGKV